MPGLMMKKRPPLDDEEDDDDVVDPVSPEEATEPTDETPVADARSKAPGQGVYDRFVRNGMRLIYSEAMLPKIMESLDGGGDHVVGLGNTVMMVVQRLQQSAAKGGAEIPADVVAQGTTELLHQLADLSAQSDGHKYTPEQMQQAAQVAAALAGSGEAPTPEGAMPEEAAEPPQRRGLLA